MRLQGPLAVLLALSFRVALAEDEYSFDLSEIEGKPLHIGGYVELDPVLFWPDEGSALHTLKLYDRDIDDVRAEYNFAALIDGSYKIGAAQFRAILNADLNKSYLGWSDETTLYEGYMSLRPSSALSFSIGKTTLKWGKGYAWNPVAFLDRPKDPTDPELAREGFVVVSADYIKSFDGPVKTFSFTPVLIPVCDGMNEDFGKVDGVNFAGKAYFLLYDTDLDFIVLTGASKATRYGMDFSRNISSNFEIHGELAFINGHEKRLVDGTGAIFDREYDATSYLSGFRYLTKSETTYIFEYYRNARGYTESEMGDYFSFIDYGYDTYLLSGDESLLERASNLAGSNYGQKNPMRDYLYLRVSQKDPFDVLYFTPSVTGIFNISDDSFSLGPELLYTGIKNLELRLRTTFLVGDSYTEYGEKQSDFWVGLRARYYY